MDRDSLRHERITGQDAYPSWAPVSQILSNRGDARGDKFAAIISTRQDGPVLYSAGPVFEGDRLVGVVLVGTPLSTLLPALKVQALADVALYDFSGRVLGTTFAADEGDFVSPPAGVLAQLGDDTAVRQTRTIAGREFDLLYATLRLREEPIGVYAAALPSSFIASAAGVTRLQMTVLFSIGTAGILIAGWLLANAITRPVSRLAATANAVSAGDLTARSGVTTHDEIGQLARAFDTMTGTLQRQHLSTIRALASAIDARDPYTLGHSVRVGKLAVSIGQEMRLSRVALQHLEIGGYLHDIGKIGVRDAVLLKPGSLTPAERQLIEDHPRIGLQILDPIELPREVRDFIAGHHEKLDGTGYPAHLRGDELSVFARIGAVADIYDALATDRPYRAALKTGEVIEMLMKQAEAGALDPRVIEALAHVLSTWQERIATDPSLQSPQFDTQVLVAS
jgi:putative nucleotidyltransferase with HDIG domain